MHFERCFFSSQFDTDKTRINPCVMFVDGGVPKFGCDMSADKKWNNNTPNVGQATATITIRSYYCNKHFYIRRYAR